MTVCGTDSLPAVLICDGFEATDPWSVHTTQSGQIAVSREQSALGTHALRAATAQVGAEASYERTLDPLPNGEYWMRFYLYAADVAFDEVSVVFMGENRPPYQGVSIDIITESSQPRLEIFSDPADTTAVSRTALPLDQWVCVGAQFELGPLGYMRLEQNGELVAESASVRTRPAGGLTQLQIGITYTGSEQAMATIFIDEFILSRNPVRCEAPSS